MNARDLLIEKLREIGADGLYNGEYGEDACGCGLNDLAPCDFFICGECEAATVDKDGLYYPLKASNSPVAGGEAPESQRNRKGADRPASKATQSEAA